jgi:hypothetical protein
MIYYYDTDGKGARSISDVLQAKPKEITRIAVNTYAEFDHHVASIAMKVTPNDLVILDTVNMLASMYRGDTALGVDPLRDLWELRSKIIGNQNHGAAYVGASTSIIRRLKNLFRCGEGARIIVTAHEAEKEDQTTIPPTKKRAPDVNPDFLKELMSSSSDVFRLWKIHEDIADDEGTVLLPSDSRILGLRETTEYVAKFATPLADSSRIKKALPNPTLPKLYEHLGYKPDWLLIYGSYGSGKSTLATSELR